ncbi:MAG: hypothetical protein SGI73_16240 [Chloroflexota bacterium]|nr:hypothetical protein [Chloroflexota bacterium]
MDTPELDDQRLDDCIADALRYETRVPPAQRARAWERLRTAAVEQALLSALPDPCSAHGDCPDDWGEAQRPSILDAAYHSVRRTWRAFRVWIDGKLRATGGLLTDDQCYRRAYTYRATFDVSGNHLYCYNTQLRFAYSMFQH